MTWLEGWKAWNLDKLIEGLIDENERNKDGEDFLGETRDISDQEAAFHCHDDEHDHYQPHTNPETSHNVLKALGFAEL